MTSHRRPLVALPVLLLAAAASASAGSRGSGTAVFAGGCFWGVEAVFEHLRGVQSVTAGYTDGQIEAVRVVYDPAQITQRELLQVFFRVAHDPTQRDHQGPDAGPEYRAVAYYLDESQRRAVLDYVAELERTRAFPRPIVTEIQPLRTFRVAEPFHQDYAARHPDDPYIVANDVPKLERLRRDFPQLYRGLPAASPVPQPAGMIHYPLRLVDLRLLPDPAYGLQLLVQPTATSGEGGKGKSVVWLRFDPEATLAWLNSAAGALRTPVPGGPAEAIQWSPTLRPQDGRGGLLLGRHRKKGALLKDHWLAVADSAPGWQAEITGQEADSLLQLFLLLAPRSHIDSSAQAAADKEHVDRPATVVLSPKSPRGISGKVAAQFVVGIDGRVEDASFLVLLASSPRIEVNAPELIRGWRFEPAQRGGRSVRQLVQQVITWP